MCALRKQYSGTSYTLRSLEGRLRNENNTLVSISVLSHFECANWLFTREEPQHYTTEKDWVIPRSRAQDFRRHDCRSWEGCLSQVDVLTHPLSCFFPNTRFCAPFPDISLTMSSPEPSCQLMKGIWIDFISRERQFELVPVALLVPAAPLVPVAPIMGMT